MTDVAVAIILSCGTIVASSIAAYAALTVAKRTKTGNGHTLGEVADSVKEDVAAIKLWMAEHIRQHEDTR